MNQRYNQTSHQKNQVVVINKFEEQFKRSDSQLSVVHPIDDYVNDPRICLTSIHLPKKELTDRIISQIIDPLKEISPQHYYYSHDTLHMTIKNIRVVHSPPNFNDATVEKVLTVFDNAVPRHFQFNTFFYKLILMPTSLVLAGTSDQELDSIHHDLDAELRKASVPDDKKYANSQYFFCNITLSRFNSEPTPTFVDKVNEISQELTCMADTVDSITLLSCNAALERRHNYGTWLLRKGKE